MKENKGVLCIIIGGIFAVICITIITAGMIKFRGTPVNGGITATGSAHTDFDSDLIVWRGSFSTTGDTTQSAYALIKKDSELTKKYLEENGINDDEMVFGAVNISQITTTQYDDFGNVTGYISSGYDLSQQVTITSTDIDKVEKISRDISALIESGVEFTSEMPQYYYTKLDEVKLQLIDEATKNARERIDIMAKESGSEVGRLQNSSLGIFQITGKNSSDDYSYGGTYNTTSREKTATITVSLNYAVK